MPEVRFSSTNQDPQVSLRPYWVISASSDPATVGHLRPDELPCLLKDCRSIPTVNAVVSMVTETWGGGRSSEHTGGGAELG